MRESNRRIPIKRMLLLSLMLFVLSVTASFAAQFTLTGIVTRNGEPCPYARVVITEQGLLPPSEFVKGTMTNQYGWYQVTKLESANSYAITVNALNAVPVIRQPFESSTSTVTLNIDLQYGRTPLYDDFSGSSVDLYDPFFNPNGKWEYFNPQYDPTGTIASITEEGTLKIDPAMGRSGIASTTAFPPCSSYECVLPKAHEGASQGFAIIKSKDTYYGYDNIVDIRDQGGSFDAPRLAGYNNSTTSYWTSDLLFSTPYPAKLTILRTLYCYDVFINGNPLRGAACANANISDLDAYIFMYGYRDSDNTSVAYFDEIRAGASVAVPLFSVSNARAATNGTEIAIEDAIVTANTSYAFWVESPDRSSGIKVISNARPTPGQKVLVHGKVVRENNEVAILAENVIPSKANTTLKPVAITGKTAAEFDKDGASAQGVYVKVAGKVTEVVTDGSSIVGYFLDDGSGIKVGNHTGLYVQMAEHVKLPADSVKQGDFLVREGPLTVCMVDETTVPSIIATKGIEYVPTFTAYNDIVCVASDPGSPNITRYSYMDNDQTLNEVPGGLLKDYATGNYVAESVVISAYNISDFLSGGGANPKPGTDAARFFTDPSTSEWITSFTGNLFAGAQNSAYWWQEITFYGLDPNALYEFVGSANKNEAGSNSYKVEISECVDCTYACSDIPVAAYPGHPYGIYSGKIDDHAVAIGLQTNTDNGHVARWINIKPSPFGTFRIRTTAVSLFENANGHGLTVFRLRKQAGVETP